MATRLTARQVCLVPAFAIPLLVYLFTLAPGLTWAHHGADGGDLVTAAYTLGVPHPPGYPTYTALAWLFTRLPVSNVAWRVNLFSAISTATAAALIYWIVTHLADETPGPPAIIAGLGAAGSYAFAPLVWSQALIAEVYAPAGLCTTLVLSLTSLLSRARGGCAEQAPTGIATVFPPRARGGLRGAPHPAFILGLVWSLGLGVHLTLIFLAPVVLWAVWPTRRSLAPRHGLYALLGFLSGLLAWLYLPLRAGRGGVTWGDPTTLAGFWWLASGALYRHYLFALPTAALGERLAALAGTWGSNLGLTGVGLALLGVVWRRPGLRGWLAATGLSFVSLNIYALGYNTADSVVYLVPAFAIASVWLGVGLIALFKRVREWGQAGFAPSRWGHPLTALMLAIALATPAWTLAVNGAALDLSDDHSAEQFGHAAISEAPQRAILLTTTDRQTFALWYYQQVEGLRPDVAIIDEGLWGFDWYRAGLRQAHPDLESSQADAAPPPTMGDARPRCRVRREAQTGWLDCQNSKAD